jgi:hypothetical protein
LTYPFNLALKNLSIGKYELFGQLSYPIGSLVNTGLFAMYNPVDFSTFVGPSVSISLHDDVEFYLTSQVMLGEQDAEYWAIVNSDALFRRLRWSF